MARKFGRYLVSTHRDPDWGSLTTTQHDCYMNLVSSPNLSWAGVLPYFPGRYTNAADLTERKVARTWDELDALDYLVIDKASGEVCVRTFLKHDEVLVKPNIVKAFIAAMDLVHSRRIRVAIASEVATIYAEQGFNQTVCDVFTSLEPDLMDVADGTRSPAWYGGLR